MSAREVRRYTLIFPPHLVGQPLTYRLVKEYDLLVNILRAHVEPDATGTVLVELRGPAEQIEAGIRFLSEQGVLVEGENPHLRFVAERCTHCGACLPVCEPQALYREGDEVRFRAELCTACFACVPYCSYEALVREG